MARSQDRREMISRSYPVSIIGTQTNDRSLTADSRTFTLSAIPIAPKVAPSLIEEKLALLRRGLIILRNVLGPRARKRETRGRRLQNFIVCHAEINNKTDLISYDLYNSFLPQGSTILIVSRPSMRMYMCTCVWEFMRNSYQVYIKSAYVCKCILSMLFAYSSSSFSFIYTRLLLAPPPVNPQFRFPIFNM